MDAGAIVEVGALRGEFAGADAAGRYVAVLDDGVLTVHDVHDLPAGVASWRIGRPADGRVAVHPGGRAVAALSADGRTLELWRAGADEPLRAPTEIGRVGSPWSVAGWVRYSGDGAYLYLGEAGDGAPARLSLLDAATLARLDTVSPAGAYVQGEPVEDWGEDVDACCAPAPSTVLAYAANAGDDLIALGVAEVVDGRLRLWQGRDPESWADIPGERSMALALAGDELIVLDSDQILSAVPWREGPMKATALAYGGDLLDDDDDDDDERLLLAGPMSARGGLLAVAVDRERWREGDQRTVALLVLDRAAGGGTAVLDLPEAGRVELVNGTILRLAGDRTQVSRWIPFEA